MANQVTLTFAGDSTKLESAFNNVGSAADRMKSNVGSASRSVGESASSFDTMGEAADGAEGKAQGFSDTLTGTKDVMGGAAEIAKGNLFEGFVMAGQGAADLAGGLASFMIPALKNGVTWIKSTTVAQKALNIAMRANPIGLVITALVLLGVGLVALYKKSETFRNIVNGAFGSVKTVAVGVFNWIRNNWKTIFNTLTAPFQLAIKPIWKHRDSILNAIRAVPGAVKGFMKNVAGTITAPFQAAFSGIKSAWNSTVGGKGFTVPGWVPNIGGKGFTIPYFHQGGIVPGGLGSESLAVLRAGERVTSTSGGGGGSVVTFRADGRYAKQLLQMLKEQLRIEGGAKVVFDL
jgi:phage-related protein